MAERIGTFQDLGKQQLLERCKELEFVDDVQDLKCTRCNRLALEHWYTNCGHALCPNCKRLLSSGGFKCPQCGQLIQHIKETSADFEEKVNGLLVKCPNSRYGCPLVTTVKLIMEHLVGCEWTKEHALPAVFTGANTMQMLLEEVSKLKTQIGDMHGTIGFLLSELHKRQEVEDDIKKSVEMSVADLNSRLNGLSSDLHFETSTLKAQAKNINLEQLQIHFSSKEEVKQQEQQLTKLDGKTNVMFQILDEKLDKFSQRLTKEIETISATIKAGEDKMEVMRNEDKINMDNFQQQQIIAFENYKQELLDNSKDLQGKIEKSNDDFKMELRNLRSESTLGLEQQEATLNQKFSIEVKQLEDEILKNESRFDEECKEIDFKIEALISDFKKQEVVLMKQIQDETKVGVRQIEEKLDSANANSNKLLIQMLEIREDRFRQKFTKEVEAIDTKTVASGDKIEAAFMKNRQETAAISKEIRSKIQLELQEVERYVKKSVEKSTEKFNNQFKQLSIDIKNDVEKFKEEIDQSNKKTRGIENNVDAILNFIIEDRKTKVETIQQLFPQLNAIEAFDRLIAIEQFVHRKPSGQQLVDSFLFGPAEEQMVFESLCFKWTIKHFEQLIPTEGSHEHMSDIFPFYGYQLKAQLKLTIKSEKKFEIRFCFKDDSREGQKVDNKHFSNVTFIFRDLSGQNKHLIRYCYCSFNSSLQYNKFDYWSNWISMPRWTALISPADASLEVLFLVEPPTIIHKPLSVNGTIMDTIEHYSRKLQMAKEKLIYGHWSPLFLTHTGGYRVAVCMCLNGSIGLNKRGLQVGIRFFSGEFDSQLGSAFAHGTSVTLINQLDATKNITVKKQEKEAKFYNMAIASGDAISSGGFLVNDSLTYHVIIKQIK